MRASSLFSVLILWLLFGCATAPTIPAHYMTVEDLPATILPPPPARMSIGFIDQIEYVIAAQQNISAADLVAMRDEQRMRLSLVTDTLGPRFIATNYPATYSLLQNSFDDAAVIIENDKDYWDTPRPYLARAKNMVKKGVRFVIDDQTYGDTTHPYANENYVQLLINPVANPAYPSGHTAQSRLLAEELALLFPSCKSALVTRANEIAGHRVQAGVHYPVDIAGGQRLASAMLNRLQQNPAFQHDLAAATAEVAHQASPISCPAKRR